MLLDTKILLDTENRPISPNFFINAKNIYGQTPLHYAANYTKTQVVTFLIQRGANVKAKTEKGDIPLHHATHLDWPGNIECINILYNETFETDPTNKDKETPLFHAARYNSVEPIKALLAKGAKVNFPDSGGRTPLDEANFWNYKEAIKVLKDTDGKSKWDKTN